jgi:hypothetical protein
LGWSDEDERRLGILLRTATLLPADDEATKAALARERRLVGWAARREVAGARLHIRPREPVELAELTDYGGFEDGWVYQGGAGIWTEGSRSELALALDGIGERDYGLALSLGSICVAKDGSLRVDALVNGEVAAVREFSYGDPEWHIELPARLPADGQVDLALVAENPSSPRELGWSDDERRLGILLSTVTLEEVDRTVRAGETVEFAAGSGAERLLGEGWSTPEPTGVWTTGERAGLVLRLSDVPPGDAEIVLAGDAFVTPEHPELDVEVWAQDERLAGRAFRYGRRFSRQRTAHRPLRVVVPRSVRDETGRTVLELRLRDPARPVDLGLGDDSRSLGLHLRSLTVQGASAHPTLWDAVRRRR